MGRILMTKQDIVENIQSSGDSAKIDGWLASGQRRRLLPLFLVGGPAQQSPQPGANRQGAPHFQYRPEIDGLRAVAVIPVILFHAGFSAFSGGFVGVDVFFVISGYLVTSIILSEMENGRFRLSRFYERRARRIFPALFFMVALCIPLAWLSLTPKDMKDFATSLVGVSTFSSNIFFWSESGYFETFAELKPLLHTWSLAVEEQYYILFPLALILAWPLGKRPVLAMLAMVFVVSLAAAHWGAYNKPSATFYLLPTRGWEILLGAFAAFYLARKDSNHRPRATISDFLSIAGLVLITFAILSFDEETPTPSLATLIPTVGALLIILFSQNGVFVQRMLSCKVMVGIGLISYSMYLWHQPLFAFARQLFLLEPPKTLMVALCLTTLAVGYVSWRFVEKPFRTKNAQGQNIVLVSSATATFILLSIVLSSMLSDGFEASWLSRQPNDVQTAYHLLKKESNLNKEIAKNRSKQDNGGCRFNVKNITDRVANRIKHCQARYSSGVAILGDSHAIDIFGVATSASEKDFIVGITRAGCQPNSRKESCHYGQVLRFVSAHPEAFSNIVYVQAGFTLLRAKKDSGSRNMFRRIPPNEKVGGIYPDKARLDNVLSYLRKLSAHVPILWLGSRVEPHISHNRILKLGCGHRFSLRELQYEVFREIDDEVSSRARQASNISFLSQNDAFKIQFPEDFMSCDEILWADGDHLSLAGERNFGQRFDLIDYLTQ